MRVDVWKMGVAVGLCGALAAPAAGDPAAAAPGESAGTPVWVVQGSGPAQHFRDPLSITCDPETQEIFVADTGNHEIAIFDADGALRFRFTHYLDDGTAGSPRCALQLADGRILVTDALATTITIANARGERLGTIDAGALVGLTGRVSPGYLARDAAGSIFVTVSGAGAGVVVLDPSLSFVRMIHGQGREAGDLKSPTGVAVDVDGRVFVTDPGAALAVSSYSPEGEFLGGFGRHESGRDNFSFPSGICLIDGVIWVGDSVRQVINGMDPGGHLVSMFGGKGTRPGDVLFPVSVATDGERLYVLDRVGGRLQAFETSRALAASS